MFGAVSGAFSINAFGLGGGHGYFGLTKRRLAKCRLGFCPWWATFSWVY
jgi:hypothetical protein